MPYVFTEHGILMLSSVLNSKEAISVTIEIMVTFIKLRHYVLSQSGTNEQIAELRKLLMLYIEKNDKRVNDIIIAFRFETNKGKRYRLSSCVNAEILSPIAYQKNGDCYLPICPLFYQHFM